MVKPFNGVGSLFLVTTVLLAGTPLACGGGSSNADPSDDPSSAGGLATGGVGSQLTKPTGGAWGSTGGYGGSGPSTGGSGTTTSPPPPGTGPNPDYEEIPYARCVAEFCPSVSGAEACCMSSDGPCGADYGNGCQQPGWQGNPGSGGFSFGGLPGWWWDTGGSANGGNGGATEPVDASPPQDAGAPSDASADAAGD